MALKLDSALADALTFRTAEGINATSFFFGISAADFRWAEESSFGMPEPISAKLASICGEGGMATFLHGEVSRILDNDPEFDITEHDRLTDLKSFSDTVSVSKALIETMKTLPFKYRLTCPLPLSFSKEFGSLCENYQLGSGVSIQSGRRLGEDFPVRTGIGPRDELLKEKGGEAEAMIPDPALLYLVQQNSGYIGRSKEAPVMTDFRSTLRQFLGIALAVRAISPAWASKSPSGSYVAHRVDGNTEIVAAEEMPRQILSFYGKLVGGEPAVSETKKAAAERKLAAIRTAFSSDDHGKRLSVASMWYLRSVLSEETLDAVLEATIAVEALFGGGGSEGAKVSAILANRCAYRIGKSFAAREDILSKFIEIYNLRSRIVHEGHHRFTTKDRLLLKDVRDYCRRSLVAEATLAP